MASIKRRRRSHQSQARTNVLTQRRRHRAILKLAFLENCSPIILSAPGIENPWLQVIGTVADFDNDGLRDANEPAVFVPSTLHISEWSQILVRSDTAPLALLRAVRKQFAALNADQQAGNESRTLEQLISEEPEWQQEHSSPGSSAPHWQTGNAHEPVIRLIATMVLIVLAALACTARARRAAKVEPMTALRYE